MAIPAAFEPFSVILTGSRLLDSDFRRLAQAVKSRATAKRQPLDQRSSPRISHALSVRSQEIPEFKAIARDLSIGGIRVEINGAVPKGQRLGITLDLDLVNSTLTTPCEVMWTRQVSQKGKYE